MSDEKVLVTDVSAIQLRRAAIRYESRNTGWKRAYLVDREDVKHLPVGARVVKMPEYVR